LGDVQIIPQKTRLVCVARVRFAGLYPRKGGFLASFALRRRLDSRRIVKTADYGRRWQGHFVVVRSEDDLDDQLRAWLQEAHDTVGQQDDLGPRPKKPLGAAARIERSKTRGTRKPRGTKKARRQEGR
jgi:hypothetical protein